MEKQEALGRALAQMVAAFATDAMIDLRDLLARAAEAAGWSTECGSMLDGSGADISAEKDGHRISITLAPEADDKDLPF